MDARSAHERRKYLRFEPPFIDAIIRLTRGGEIRGRILDASCEGLAVALPEDAEITPEDGVSSLAVAHSQSVTVKTNVGEAVVKRTWPAEKFLDTEKGVALKFSSALTSDDFHKLGLHGIQQKTRLEAQAELARADIGYLGDYRRDLINCQMKLFALTLTIGVALAGAYFGLIYHSVATNQLANPTLGFWRAMVAALPGFLAIGCSLMVAHKSISIQRIDSYLRLLKQHSIKKQYPREYRGWESEYAKYRTALKSNRCLSCKCTRKCGELTEEDHRDLAIKTILRRPMVDLYHIVMYMSFFSAFSLSIVAVVGELLAFQPSGPIHMAIGSGITLCILAAVGALFYIFYHLRKGRYSSVHFRRCWTDLLNRCRWH